MAESNNTYYTIPKDDPKDRIQIEVGDSKQVDFHPQVKIMRWDNECNFSARLVNNELTPTVSTQADKIIWQGDKTEAHFYDIASNEEHPEGVYEFEVILKEKPLTNKIEFTLETKGLDFFYQPELTQEEIDQGDSRPENVVGSYAVYHKTKGGMNDIAGMEYKVGKALHIYRPKVTDADGKEVWGELNINEQNDLLTVTIDQVWLDNAVYPVIVDPTFGTTTVGGTEGSLGTVGDQANSTHSVVGSAGTIDSISYYGKKVTTSLGILGVLYLVSNLSVVQSGTEILVSSATAQWWTSPDFNAAISATNYYVGFINDFGSAGDNLYYYYDTVGSANRISEFITAYPTPDDPGTAIASVRKLSIYATYTAAGGGYGDAFISDRDLLGVGV